MRGRQLTLNMTARSSPTVTKFIPSAIAGSHRWISTHFLPTHDLCPPGRKTALTISTIPSGITKAW